VSQWTLLGARRFWPLFWTQFLGAFNDNVFKNALVILIAYRSLTIWGLGSQQLVVVASGVFILPFFLFSAFSGQLADKFRKNVLIRGVKLLEIAIMALGAVGFYLDNLELLLGVLFLMGTHSSIFGPSKFSILPELVRPEELVGSNALVEMGTFVAILLGTIGGGLLVASGEHSMLLTSLSVVTLAVAGAWTSWAIPPTPAGDPALKVHLDPFRPMVSTLRIASADRSVFLSILGISWFWFFGAGLLSLMPSYCRDVLRGNEHVVTFCLALFCVGIAVGSLLCERLSRRRLELGLVPFGSIGMSLFAADLFVVGSPYPAGQAPAQLLGLAEFLLYPQAWRVSFDLAVLAIFGGVFTVPLYTLIQQRSPSDRRSRVIAGNNVLNSLFMVLSAGMLFGLLAADFEIPTIYLILALGNLAVAVYIYTLLPEFLLRFVTWIVANLLYRLRVLGVERIPVSGPCILICNHVSYVDWLLISAACPRPPRFVMDHSFLKLPLLGFVFRDAKVIPIAPAHENQGLLDEAFDRIAEELERGELVCLFPEGKITSDGGMNVFRTGIERIVARTPVPVLPLAIDGMWGSIFSRKDQGKLRNPFRKLWARIDLRVGETVPVEQIRAADLARRVAALGGFRPPELGD
jgi:1-acyl-sn-glycerol-3-phosphate acyltransferase